MADWRIRKRYGHGSARVVLCPEPWRVPVAEGSFAGDFREIGPELFGGAKTGVAFALVIVAIFFFTVMRDRVDLSHTQLLVWQDEKPVPIAPPSPPVPKLIPVAKKPEPVVAKVEPKPVPKPVVKPKAKPKPPPVKIAKVEPPKALPKPKPVAKAKPKPKPAKRKPKIQMAALKKPDIRKTAPVSRTRATAAKPDRRKAVALNVAAMNSPALPSASAAATSRAQRVSADKASRSRPAPNLALAQNQLPLPDASAARVPTRSGPAFASVRGKATSRPVLEAAAAPGIAVAADSGPRPTRSASVAAIAPAARRPRADIGAAPAALAPARPTRVPEIPTPHRVTTARANASVSRSRGAESDLTLKGVSLGSLASCVSDRQEDLLKQRVLAAVRNREACVSSVGTYRFVETKNLNAFSMWIQRSSGRGASDRCAELNHALACLE